MATNAYSLARTGSSSTLARVTQVLDGFASRDRSGEMLTAVRHYPARGAQWAEFPDWVTTDWPGSHRPKGSRQRYRGREAVGQAVHAGKIFVTVTGKFRCK